MYTKTNCGWMKACQLSSIWKMENTWKIIILFPLHINSLHWIKLENFVLQLKRQSVEAWQNEKHYSIGNNTSETPIPRQEIFKPVDHVKYEGQVRSQHLLFVQFSRWAFKKFHQKRRNASCGAQFKYFQNQVSKKSFNTFQDIDLLEPHAKLQKKTSETLRGDWI